MHELTPYFIDSDDLNQKPFSSMRKRELITPLTCEVKIISELSPYDDASELEMTFDKRSTTSVQLGSIIVRVSMEDLYTLNTLSLSLAK
jgi:hypothetical protein